MHIDHNNNIGNGSSRHDLVLSNASSFDYYGDLSDSGRLALDKLVSGNNAYEVKSWLISDHELSDQDAVKAVSDASDALLQASELAIIMLHGINIIRLDKLIESTTNPNAKIKAIKEQREYINSYREIRNQTLGIAPIKDGGL